MKQALFCDADLQAKRLVPGCSEFVLNFHDEFQIKAYHASHTQLIGEPVRQSIIKAGDHFQPSLPARPYSIGRTWADSH